MSTTFRRARTGLYIPRGTTYAAEILADAPRMFLKLDEAAGASTAMDATGNGANVPAANVSWGQASLLTDGSGTSASFNGANALLSLPAVGATWMDSAAVTVEAVIKWDGASDQFIATRWAAGGNRPWLFVVSAAGKLQGSIDGSGTLVTGATTLSSLVPSTVALRANGATVDVFLNGILDGTVAHAGPTQQGSAFEVARAALAVFSSLRVDCISFWTSAISDARLAAHHAAR